MCLRRKDGEKLRVAKEDITVYKIIEKRRIYCSYTCLCQQELFNEGVFYPLSCRLDAYAFPYRGGMRYPEGRVLYSWGKGRRRSLETNCKENS